MLGEENEQEELCSENEKKLQAKRGCWQKSNILAKKQIFQKVKNTKMQNWFEIVPFNEAL